MAMSKCLKCDNGTFELVIKDRIAGANVKLCFIQCSRCGTVIGTTSYFDPGLTTQQINEKVEKLEGRINDIDYNVRAIMQGLSR